MIGNGDGTFQPAITHTAYTGGSLSSVVIGDFNRDDKLDFVTVWSDDVAGTSASVWLNTSCSAGFDLHVARDNGAITISWSFPSTGFLLQSSTNLSPTSWNLFDRLPVNKNGRWEVTVPTTQSQGYFRLRKP